MHHHSHYHPGGQNFEQAGNDPFRYTFKVQQGNSTQWHQQLESDKALYNIVLDGADEQFGQAGWCLDVLGDKQTDIRDDASTRLCIRKHGPNMTGFKLIPKDNGASFMIQLGEDPHNIKKKDHTAACHYWYDFDKRDDDSIRAFVHQDASVKNTHWTLQPTGDGQTFYIQIGACDTEVTKGVDISKWYLAAHRYYDQDKRDDNSTYCFFHKSPPNGHKWRIVRDNDPFKSRQLVRVDPFNWGNAINNNDRFNIVLDHSDDEYHQAGWSLEVLSGKNNDSRDDASQRLALAKSNNKMSAWQLVSKGNNTYQVLLASDPHTGNFNNSTLACHFWYDQDKRDDSSYRAMVHKDQGVKNTQMVLAPNNDGTSFTIKVTNTDPEVTKNVDICNFQLAAHRYYDHDKRDDNSTYCFFHQNPPNGNKWRLYKILN